MTEKAPERIDVIRIENAATKATEILAPQLGSDKTILAEGKIDTRRMTRLNKLEIVALTYFRQEAYLEDNEWLKGFIDDYESYKMSEEGHERVNLIVEALGKIGGWSEDSSKTKDERGWLGRNITARNKDPEE